jgi:hypothetical protein
MTIDHLLKAIDESDAAAAGRLFDDMIRTGDSAWDIHLSLSPAVQRVLNPPFINPHLPKMYCIYRELVPYLKENEVSSFVRLEITEYARRPKLEKIDKASLPSSPVSFSDIETAIRSGDRERTAALSAAFLSQKGPHELARRMLFLGSGYLDHSLGHSVSCTAFILLEMLARPGQDPWPASSVLADYFCKGRFGTSPSPRKLSPFSPAEAIKHHLLRATSGRGIVNLHHTITVYAMERVRHLFNEEEYGHLINSWISFLGDKEAEPLGQELPVSDSTVSYGMFHERFAAMEVGPLLPLAGKMVSSPQNRQDLGRFLIKALCDRYNGDYNPHYVTGLGSTLWVMHHFGNQPSLAMKGLSQYIDFLFAGLRSEK